MVREGIKRNILIENNIGRKVEMQENVNMGESAGLNNLNDSQSQIVNYAQRIQSLDEQIAELKALRKETLKELKNLGFNSVIVNQVITLIRKEKKTDPGKKSESELYYDLLESIIEPLE